jgi:ubiquinone/menaquinone biosynthesis C-methylase UbiE
MTGHDEWREVYKRYPASRLPWELGRPRGVLVDLVEGGTVPGQMVLDMCCGAGSNTLYLARTGFSVTGMDISLEAVQYTGRRARKEKLKVSLVACDFAQMPFAAGTFDLVLDFGCFHRVSMEQRKDFIYGIARILNDGGFYQMTCFSYRNGPAWNHFTEQQVRDHFSDVFSVEGEEHYGSLENDGAYRHFFTFLFQKKPGNQNEAA